eukprot:1161529-Pelagomonas_calceolata.AAC.13
MTTQNFHHGTSNGRRVHARLETMDKHLQSDNITQNIHTKSSKVDTTHLSCITARGIPALNAPVVEPAMRSPLFLMMKLVPMKIEELTASKIPSACSFSIYAQSRRKACLYAMHL